MLIPWVDGITQAEVQKLGTQGVALPIEQLIKDNAPNIQKQLDSNKTLKEMSTAPTGTSTRCRSGRTASTAPTRTSCGSTPPG